MVKFADINSLSPEAKLRAWLNASILTNPYWFLPVDNKGHENLMQAGHCLPISTYCGHHAGWNTCIDIAGHEGKSYKGEDFTGYCAVHPINWFCKSIRCCVCFNYSACVRSAFRVVCRIKTAVELGLGVKAEHVSVSFSEADSHWDVKYLRDWSRRCMEARGVVGGCDIFHGFRIDRKRRVLKYSPHFHGIALLEDGFDRCRNCKHVKEDCLKCDGFKGREMREYKKDDVLVKVHEERQSLAGTVWYLLNHSTIDVSSPRFHVVSWWGNCGYRKFKTEKFPQPSVCKVCGGQYVKRFVDSGLRLPRHVSDRNFKSLYRVPLYDEDGNKLISDIEDMGEGEYYGGE
jgi:hypothetical protein